MAPCSVHKELYNAPLFVCLISEISSYEFNVSFVALLSEMKCELEIFQNKTKKN